MDLKDAKVLVTGLTGFKGTWLSLLLDELGAKVIPLRSPPANRDQELGDYLGLMDDFAVLDVTDRAAVAESLRLYKPDLIFHMAAEAFVGESARNPFRAFDVNLVGTQNVFREFFDSNYGAAALHVSTDKVYPPSRLAHAEESEIGGSFDPYSASKVAAEWALRSLFAQGSDSGKKIATARGGNVIGGGDSGPGRISSDVWRAMKTGNPVYIRNPSFTRPWQHVIDCLTGYVAILAAVASGQVDSGEEFNVSNGDNGHTVLELANAMLLGDREIMFTDGITVRENPILEIDNAKILASGIWSPKYSFEASAQLTRDWMLADINNEDMRYVTRNQIRMALGFEVS